MKQEIFWQTTATMPDDSHLTPLPEAVDVAVIGGGYTGLGAALTFAKRGTSVAVLEAETMGWGASSRNGGMTLTGLKIPMQTAIRRYGKPLARELFQTSLDSVATVERLVAEEAIDCGFARTGHLLAANKPKHFDALKGEVDFMAREFHHKVHLVAPGEMRNEIGTDIYPGALVDEASAGLNPAQFVAGLARAAEKAGAKLCARARVLKIEGSEPRFLLHTARGILRAESVFVASSGYTGGVTPALQRKIIPIGSFIIATEALPETLTRELSPKNRMIFDYKHFLNYFRLWKNRLIFGGRAAFFPENENTISQSGEILRREMIQIYPQLKAVKVDYVWGGTLDFAFDQMTHVGKADGLHYSLGYAGHGAAMGTHLGVKMAEAMMTNQVGDLPFAKVGFPGVPFYNGSLWLLPLVGLWHKILDWAE